MTRSLAPERTPCVGTEPPNVWSFTSKSVISSDLDETSSEHSDKLVSVCVSCACVLCVYDCTCDTMRTSLALVTVSVVRVKNCFN